MTTTGPFVVDSGTSAAGLGVDWTSPGNITTDDTSYASAVITAAAPDTDQLIGTYTSFSIGATDTIQGFEAVITHDRDGAGAVSDLHVYLVINGVVLTAGDDKPNAGSWAATDESITYGGPTDVWGYASPVGATINGLATGVALIAHRDSGASPTVKVDNITIKVYYTVAGPVTNINKLMMMGAGT